MKGLLFIRQRILSSGVGWRLVKAEKTIKAGFSIPFNMILVSHALAFPVLFKGVDNAEDLAHRYLLPLHLQGQLTVSRGSACLRGSSEQTACEVRDGLGFDVIVFACVLMSLQKANAFILFVKCLLSG